jgi:hypothetical protein
MTLFCALSQRRRAKLIVKLLRQRQESFTGPGSQLEQKLYRPS